MLETLIKNCGDNVHQQVAEKDVLHELVKLVKKKVSCYWYLLYHIYNLCHVWTVSSNFAEKYLCDINLSFK